MKQYKALMLILIVVLSAAPIVKAYHYECLSEGESLPTGWVCEHDCCMLCLTDSGYSAPFYRCAGLPGCSCDGGSGDTDLQPPEITIVEPHAAHSYNNRYVPFDIVLSEVAYKLDFMEVGRERYGWTKLCPGKCASYQGKRTFEDGQHTITVRAIDRKGNTDKKNVSFYVDSVAPRIRRTLPTRADYCNGTFIIQYTEQNVVNITLDYKDAGSADYKRVAKEDCPSGANVECRFSVDGLAQGRLLYRFAITDRATTMYTEPVEVLVDTIAPELSIVSPPNPYTHVFDTRSIPFEITTNEPSELSYMDTTESRPKWKRLCRDCTTYSRTESFQDGYHHIVIRAIDKAGNSAEATREFYVDSKQPRIRSTLPKKGSYGNGTLSVTYDEDNLVNTTLFFRTDNGLSYNKLSTHSCPSGRNQKCVFELGGVSNGLVYYYFVVQDISGSKAQSKPVSFVLDTAKPVLNIHEPIDEAKINNKKLWFNLSVSEPAAVEYSLDGRRWQRLCRDCDAYYSYKSVRDGNYQLRIRATDKASNSVMVTRNIIADSTKPRIQKLMPRQAGNGWFNLLYTETSPSRLIFFYSTAQDSHYANRTFTGLPAGKNQNYDFFVPEIAALNGDYVYYFVELIDEVGLVTRQRSPARIFVDTEQPVMNIENPAPGMHNDRRIPFDIDVSEPCKISYINHASNNPTWKTLCRSCSSYHSYRYFSYGEYQLEIRAEDKAGNSVTQNIAFSVQPADYS